MKTTYKTKIKNLILAAILIFAGTLMVSANTSNKPSEFITNNSIQAEADYSLESWMLNLNEWSISSDYTFEIELEQNMEIEQWMVNANESYWNKPQADSEEDLEVEDWMTNLAKW